MTETAEQNRYQRALEASFAQLDREQATRGHTTFFEHNHRVLTEHAPAAGPTPQCSSTACGKPWPCEDVTTAMTQVGVRS
ncbi:hypothetical protein STAN_1886 [Streptomyces sp. CBMAI 2042]|uniref:hypothetical protein n=1 Tax=Streptomyces sp. CBMAI 2042 TaxID=2305222 RepID=UPI000F13C368|nr:hypothetical protein [Streptomyces sp. CBMAI 2042]RLV66365.1 hypothetical protein STAN_1886 [Streptomyces sp. CBMAI 2042]